MFGYEYTGPANGHRNVFRGKIQSNPVQIVVKPQS
jgi:hypothetical protein